MIQERSISISTQTIIKVIVTILVLMFLWAVRDIIALVFAALILAALMNPVAQWGARYKIPKGVTVLFFYLLFFGGLIASITLALPEVVQQFNKLTVTMQRSWQALASGADWLRGISQQYGLTENIQAGIISLQEQTGSVVGRLFSTISGLFGGLVGMIVVLVIAFYMVAQEEEALKWFKHVLPDEYEALTTRLLQQVQAKFGAWLLGQIALGVIVGVLYYIGLRILGVEGALVLAVVGGFTEFIPYLGPILGAIPAVLVAATQSPTLAFLTMILYLLIQQAENHILTPKIMQKAVGLNPVLSIVSLLIGGQLFGIPGMLLAIPVTTAIGVALTEWWRFQKKE